MMVSCLLLLLPFLLYKTIAWVPQYHHPIRDNDFYCHRSQPSAAALFLTTNRNEKYDACNYYKRNVPTNTRKTRRINDMIMKEGIKASTTQFFSSTDRQQQQQQQQQQQESSKSIIQLKNNASLCNDLPWIIDTDKGIVNGMKSLNNTEMGDSTNDNAIQQTQPQQQKQQFLVVRMMDYTDIESIVQMNVQEYSSGPAYVPLTNLKLLEAWLDRLYLQYLVDISCRIKLLLYNQPSSQAASILFDSNQTIQGTAATITTNDHAIIVIEVWDRNSNNNKNSNPNPENLYRNSVVGMIEVSLQPCNPYCTPPPIPIPLFIKRLIASLSRNNDDTRSSSLSPPPQQQRPLLVGWITNVLIRAQYRKRGYSKLLLQAAEYIAKYHWNCTSIHLHCDADPISGAIAQRLYTNNGYRRNLFVGTEQSTINQRQNDIWNTQQSTTPPTNSVVQIEGVPLLYLYKDL